MRGPNHVVGEMDTPIDISPMHQDETSTSMFVMSTHVFCRAVASLRAALVQTYFGMLGFT
jgi:hypothetical protein